MGNDVNAVVVPDGNRFDASLMPKWLADAGNALQKLISEGITTEWQDCAQEQAIEAQKQAIQSCRHLVDEADRMIMQCATSQAQMLRERADRMEALATSPQ